MAKFQLDVDALRVESFATAAAGAERGTVRAHSDPEPADPDAAFLPITDWKTCQGDVCTARTLCYYTCNGDCYGAEPV
jgi:hypothetical protein